MKHWLGCLGLLMIMHCGSGSDQLGGMEVVVHKSLPPPSSSPSRSLERFRVTVTGEGMDTPVIAEFDASQQSGVVEGIPIGKHRQVQVDAINQRGQTIRSGESGYVEVRGHGLAHVAIDLESVPIFENLFNESVVDNTRLIFDVFADPGEEVMIEDRSHTQELVSPSTSAAPFSLDISTGAARFHPQLLTPGDYVFVVRSLETGRESEVHVKLTDGWRKRAAPLFPAASLTDHLVTLDWRTSSDREH